MEPLQCPSPPDSSQPATPEQAAVHLDDCEVSPLSFPAPRPHLTSPSPALRTHLRKAKLVVASSRAFTIPTPPRRNAISIQGTLRLGNGREREDECLEPGTSCILCYDNLDLPVADIGRDTTPNNEHNSLNSLNTFTMAEYGKNRELINDNKDKHNNNSNYNKMTNTSTRDDQVTDPGPSLKYPYSRFRRPSAPLEDPESSDQSAPHQERLLASRRGLLAAIHENADALPAQSAPDESGKVMDAEGKPPRTPHTFTFGPDHDPSKQHRRSSLQSECHAPQSPHGVRSSTAVVLRTPDNEINNGNSNNDFGSSPADGDSRGRSDTPLSGPDACPRTRKSSSSSSIKGDPALFQQRLINLGLLHSSSPSSSSLSPAAFVKPDIGKRRAVAPSESLPSLEVREDTRTDENEFHSDGPISSSSAHKLISDPAPLEQPRFKDPATSSASLCHLTHDGRYQDQDKLGTLWSEGAHPISSDSISSAQGSSSAGGRIGTSQTRQRDSSLTTQHMASSPPQRYKLNQASHSHDTQSQGSYLPNASRAPPSPANVVQIFAQRGHASASGHPPVRPFEPAQWIPDLYQQFAGSEQSAQVGAGYSVGGHLRSGYYGLGQFGSGPTLQLPYIPSQSNLMAKAFYPQQPYPQQQPLCPQQQYHYPQHQPRYKGGGGGARPPHSDTSIGNPHIPPHLNTCLWLEGFPATLTYAELTASIRHCDRIFCAYINEPQNGHLTCAAKIAFFSRAGAERLLAQFYRGEFRIRGAPLRCALWNRNAYTGSCHPTATRILLIRGPAKWVNLTTLSSYFRRLFWCHLVRVDDVSMTDAAAMAGDGGWLESGLGTENLAEEYREMAAMRWEFGSFHAQAQAAKQACERETAFMGLVKVNYLADPCDYTG